MSGLESKMAQQLSPKRFAHSLGVADAAAKLAQQYGVSEEKAYIAGLVHDYARELPADRLISLARELGVSDVICEAYPELLHAPVGAHLIRQDLGIEDPEIIQAVASHTLGRRNMSKLEQIIYFADMVEMGRKYPGVDELRKKAQLGLHIAVLAALEHTIKYLLVKGKPIHSKTIEARNYLIMEGKNF